MMWVVIAAAWAALAVRSLVMGDALQAALQLVLAALSGCYAVVLLRRTPATAPHEPAVSNRSRDIPQHSPGRIV